MLSLSFFKTFPMQILTRNATFRGRNIWIEGVPLFDCSRNHLNLIMYIFFNFKMSVKKMARKVMKCVCLNIILHV